MLKRCQGEFTPDKSTLDEICSKLKMSKESFKKLKITYDYKGRLLPSLKKTNQMKKRYASQVAFKINTPQILNNTMTIMPKTNNNENEKIIKDNPIIVPMSLIDINLTYGVKYNSGKKTISGLSFYENPIRDESQMPLKQYTELCGSRSVTKYNKRLGLTETTKEELITANSINAIVNTDTTDNFRIANYTTPSS